jgi:hypothetical protein
MKVLDLQCQHGHAFEGWFGSETDFQTQDGFDAIISSGKKFDACIWAQGQNASDTLSSAGNFDAIFEANIGISQLPPDADCFR